MGFFNKYFEKLSPNKIIFNDLAELKIRYNKDCTTVMEFSGNEVSCLVSVYPKELFIQEIE